MGIATNLRQSLDREYTEFVEEKFPKTATEAAEVWNKVFKDEIAILLAPMIPFGLLDTGSSKFALTSEHFEPTGDAEYSFPEHLDEMMDTVANEMKEIGDGPVKSTPPTTAFDSRVEIFDINPTPESFLTVAKICQNAEDRTIAWLSKGKFTAFYITPGKTPAGSPGVPNTPWIIPIDVPLPVEPDTDGDTFTDKEELDAVRDGVPTPTDPGDENIYPADGHWPEDK